LCRLCQGTEPNGWWGPEDVLAGQDLSGKTYMVTGANVGIGFATAQVLLAAGANVIVSTRSTVKTNNTIDRLVESLPSSARERAKGVSMDLSSFSSIEAGVKKFNELGVKRLDAICLNAGVMMIAEFTETKEGFEMQWGVNHLGHFYLFKLLEPTILKLPGHTRIVVVSSEAHYDTPNDFTVDTHLPPKQETYQRLANYAISKLSNIYMARGIAKRFEGKGMSSYSVHPGWITGTSLLRHFPSCTPYFMDCCMYFHCSCLWFADYKSVMTGASAQLYLMTRPLEELSSGGYYVGCRLQNSSSLLYKYPMNENDEEVEKLWKLSESIIANLKDQI
jgi:retinol dehydrogenase-12